LRNGSSVPTEDLPPLTPGALRRWARAEGLSAACQTRILDGVYRRDAPSFAALDDVGGAWRRKLAASFSCSALPAPFLSEAADGTRKLLFTLAGGGAIEAVLIPMRAADGARRYTVCVSSQIGCAMGCSFCATATLGLRRNLTAAEIAGQVQAARRLLTGAGRVGNVVFMGMGEPLHNYDAVVEAIEILRAAWGFGLSSRRITVSTVGLLPQLERLVAETDVAVAVSLTATENALRDRLMPINRRFPLAAIARTCRQLPIAQRRRVTFEYVLLAGVNDAGDDARRLIELLRGVRAKVNLIPFNPYPGSIYRRPTPLAVRSFQERLLAGNLSATVRKTRGDRVNAACGQLAATPAPAG
jgi:23S rRNA (adenine2503-C2)-methyltransferase